MPVRYPATPEHYRVRLRQPSPGYPGTVIAGDHLRRVAVVRALNGLGDLLCSVPALRSLRAGVGPACRIELVGTPAAAWFVDRFPALIDELVPLTAWPGLPEAPGTAADALAFCVAAQARGYDLALNLHGSGLVTNALVAMLGARRTAGFRPPGVEVEILDIAHPYPGHAHEIDRGRALVMALGCPDAGRHLELPVREADIEALDAVLDAHGVPPGPYAVLHPGANDQRRRWSPQRFAAVADALAGEGLQPIVTGHAAEASVVAEVVDAAACRPVDLAGATDLSTLAALVAGAELVVSNDTGVAHLAVAVDTPSVVVFQLADPARWAPLDAERHRTVVVEGTLGSACVHPAGGRHRCLGEACVLGDAPRVPAVSPDESLAVVVDAARSLVRERA